ncbi:hypothetical protein B0H19DRAFT_1085571 [Mycena capillaripes]|nr:hypothetical protein B0H19DRAFT_1085571 [Mycena capillaripes]
MLPGVRKLLFRPSRIFPGMEMWRVQLIKAGVIVEDLALWFTKSRLKINHENQMFKLLPVDLRLSDGSTSAIETTYFVITLAQACSNPDAYRTASHFGSGGLEHRLGAQTRKHACRCAAHAKNVFWGASEGGAKRRASQLSGWLPEI